jgi:hypothetical protein
MCNGNRETNVKRLAIMEFCPIGNATAIIIDRFKNITGVVIMIFLPVINKVFTTNRT